MLISWDLRGLNVTTRQHITWHIVDDEMNVNFVIALVHILQETDAKMGFNV